MEILQKRQKVPWLWLDHSPPEATFIQLAFMKYLLYLTIDMQKTWRIVLHVGYMGDGDCD